MKHYYTSLSNIPSLEPKKTKPSAKVVRNILNYSVAIKLFHTTGIVAGSQWESLVH